MSIGRSAQPEVQALVLLLALSLAVALAARRLRFPYTLALVLAGLALGVLHLTPDVRLEPDLVLLIFLPVLLFEGAWNADVSALRADWRVIALLAVPGLLLSLVVIGLVLHWGAGLPLVAALLVGAIVSPTDPVAVIALLRQLGMPVRLRTIIEGESLFNDGIGTVAYAVILGLLLLGLGDSSPLLVGPFWLVALKLLWLCVGGPIVGVAVGLLVTGLVRQVDDYLIEATVTFSVAYGVYLLGDALGTSGLLAVVCAGLTLGSVGRRIGMSARTQEAVDQFWEFIGYLANSLLFLLLGVHLGAAGLSQALAPIAWAVLGVVLGRALMIYVFLPFHDAVARWQAQRRAAGVARGSPPQSSPEPVPRGWRPLLLLAGLRGALSIALALSLPALIPDASRLQLIVYGVVLVTLVGQGILMRLLLPRWPGLQGPKPAAAPQASPGPLP
jgi:CPA1 family monovalent cation:H+ antiporter